MRATQAETSVKDMLCVARDAQRAALYDAALEALDGCEDWDDEYSESAVLVKADTIARRDPSQALEYLATVDDLCFTPAARFEREVLTGKLYATVRDYSSAESHYAEARQLADQAPNGVQTMAYHDLRMRWIRRECDPHAPEIEIALAHPDPSIVSAAFAYRGWLHAGNRDYEAHIDDLIHAVRFASGDQACDVATLATSIHALAQVSFEMANAGGVAAARVASEALAWTPDVAVQHFSTIRALGWDAFMRGSPGQAQWAFKEARAVAPSSTWRIMGHLDRAYVARISGNEFWALEELAQADALAFEVAWESSFGEERQVLVSLAVMHAPGDAPRAQRYATMYSRIGTENVNPSYAVHGDRRALAHARYAQGRIAQTLGRRTAAIEALREAFEIFESASFHYRAVLAATALAELTADDTWRRAALAHAGRYPNCPLAAAAETAVEREAAMPPQLSPVQRQIARAVWNGTDEAELSRRFSRSQYRIQRQIEAIYAAFEVGSREELHAEAQRRGLT